MADCRVVMNNDDAVCGLSASHSIHLHLFCAADFEIVNVGDVYFSATTRQSCNSNEHLIFISRYAALVAGSSQNSIMCVHASYICMRFAVESVKLSFWPDTWIRQ